MLCPKWLIRLIQGFEQQGGNGRGDFVHYPQDTGWQFVASSKSMPRPLAALHAPFRRGNRHRAKPPKAAAEALRQPNGCVAPWPGKHCAINSTSTKPPSPRRISNGPACGWCRPSAPAYLAHHRPISRHTRCGQYGFYRHLHFLAQGIAGG